MDTRRKWRKPTPRNLIPIIFALGLFAYMGFLLVTNYLSQLDKQKKAVEQFRQDVEKHATAISYFFFERRNDLRNLSENRAISVFYENKALGMSMQYGLQASLLSIGGQFKRFIEEKRIGGDKIYHRLVLIDDQGEMLVDSNPADPKKREGRDWKKFLTPVNAGPVTITEGHERLYEVIITIPYFFKGNYSGQIIAWINPQPIFEHLLGTVGSSSRALILACDKNHLHLPMKNRSDFPDAYSPSLVNIEFGTLYPFRSAGRDGAQVDMIAIRMPARETTFSLVEVLPASALLGRTPPWEILLVMGGLSVLLLSGTIVLWRNNTKNLILQARFDEAFLRKKEIEEKNKQLEIEINRRERAEEQLRDYNRNLQKIIRERTKELEKSLDDLKSTQSRLLQSEKMASIGQLAAGVAHEINNPVGFVKSNLNTLNDYRQDVMKLLDGYRSLEGALNQERQLPLAGPIPQALENVQKIKDKIDLSFILADYQKVVEESEEGLQRVAKIVSDLKNFSHLDKAELEHADLNKGIESTLNIVWNELKYKAEVIKDLGDIPLVKCYPQRMNQVFMNILVNAAQAIVGKGTIRISTRALNDHVEIQISDTGKGIPPEVLPKIFDPFFTTKAVGKGTGLGLNVVYNIIQQHKGTIDVESDVGKGTTFIIRLETNPELGSNGNGSIP